MRHRRLELLLHRSVARKDGSLVVTTGRDVMPFVCEDSPLFVLTIDDADAPGTLLLADERRVPLREARALVVDAEGRMRLKLPLGPQSPEAWGWALAFRPAAQWMEHRMEERDAGRDDDVVALLRWDDHVLEVKEAAAGSSWIE